MTARKKLSDEEMKRRLIADANDPDAWEPVAVVGPSKSPRPSWYGKSRRISRAGAEEALRRMHLHDAIAALPEVQRHTIQLWLDGFTYADIARVLGISPDAVRSRLRDARRTVKANASTSSRDFRASNHRTGGGAAR